VLRLMDEARASGMLLAVCSAATKSSVVYTLKSLLGEARFRSLDCFLAGEGGRGGGGREGGRGRKEGREGREGGGRAGGAVHNSTWWQGGRSSTEQTGRQGGRAAGAVHGTERQGCKAVPGARGPGSAHTARVAGQDMTRATRAEELLWRIGGFYCWVPCAAPQLDVSIHTMALAVEPLT
jgi:hypothetical protein